MRFAGQPWKSGRLPSSSSRTLLPSAPSRQSTMAAPSTSRTKYQRPMRSARRLRFCSSHHSWRSIFGPYAGAPLASGLVIVIPLDDFLEVGLLEDPIERAAAPLEVAAQEGRRLDLAEHRHEILERVLS